MATLFALLLLSIVVSLQSRLTRTRGLAESSDPPRYLAIKLSNDVGSAKTGIYLILFNRTLHRLEDEKTLATLDVDLASVETVSSLPSQFELRDSIPPIVYNRRDADDIIRVEVLKSQIFMGPLLRDITDIGGYINPSLAVFRGRLLLATGVAWTLSGMNDGLPASDMVHIKWLNNSRYPFYSEAPYLGVGMRLQPVHCAGSMDSALGQDPRLMLFQDKLHLTFTNRHIIPHLRLSMAELGVVGGEGRQGKETLQTERYFFQVAFDSPHPQKNWVPFVYHNELLYLSRINPLEVVRVSPLPEENSGGAQVIGGAPHVDTRWQYGEIRGGTNAIQIDEHRHLAIFHSSTQLPSHFMITYFMGAFVFSTQGGSFRLLSISPLPIMEEGLYSGPWHPFRNRRIDYCIFPTTLLKDEHDPDTALLIFGHQDVRGLMASLSISRLLASLVPLHYDMHRPEHP